MTSENNYLILGCSHSMGSYEWANSDDKSKQKIGCDETWVKYSKSWEHYLKIEDAKSITSIAFPGEGYSMWAQFLTLMDKLGELKHFDKIIIQETFEPRTSFINEKGVLWEILNGFRGCCRFKTGKVHKIIFSTDEGCTSLDYGINLRLAHVGADVMPKYEKLYEDTCTSSLHDWIVPLCMDKVVSVLKKNNITGYTFSFHENHLKEYLTNIKDEVYQLITDSDKNFKADTNGHLTDSGQRYLAKVLQKEMK
ncbi:hypothetical protein HN615_05285 [Candidatus Woesearchaeota archaeon]|jgi:hypothetical protein|nr:hypothetical protein [Candidatus Woesearchaeota archaeon]